MPRTKIFIVVFASMCLELGCAGKVHVRKDHGEKSSEWFERQKVNEEGSKERVEGLDSEEASAIHGEYRSTIGSGRPAKQEDPRVLILDEGQGNARRNNN